MSPKICHPSVTCCHYQAYGSRSLSCSVSGMAAYCGWARPARAGCLSRGWTQRSVLAPAGPSASHTSPAQQAYLTEHNGIAKLSSYLAWTAHLLGLHVVIEQPVSSLLFSYGPISCLIHGIKATSVSFGMSTFEGSTPKPLLLKGTGQFLQTFDAVSKIQRKTVKKPQERLVTVGKKRSNGQACFTGKSNELTKSSGYTQAFGRAMALSFLGHNPERSASELIRLGHGIA